MLSKCFHVNERPNCLLFIPKPITFENLVKNDEIHFIKIKRCRMTVIETTNDPPDIK